MFDRVGLTPQFDVVLDSHSGASRSPTRGCSIWRWPRAAPRRRRRSTWATSSTSTSRARARRAWPRRCSSTSGAPVRRRRLTGSRGSPSSAALAPRERPPARAARDVGQGRVVWSSGCSSRAGARPQLGGRSPPGSERQRTASTGRPRCRYPCSVRGERGAVSSTCSMANCPFRAGAAPANRGRPWAHEAIERRRLGYDEAAVELLRPSSKASMCASPLNISRRDASSSVVMRWPIARRSAVVLAPPVPVAVGGDPRHGIHPHHERRLLGAARPSSSSSQANWRWPSIVRSTAGAPIARRSQESHPPDVEGLRDRAVGAGLRGVG